MIYPLKMGGFSIVFCKRLRGRVVLSLRLPTEQPSLVDLFGLFCRGYSFPDAPCMEYLPTKLVDFWGFNVGIYIPAPWSIWDS